MTLTRILVAYTTNSGTTEEVARTIAEELGRNGSLVEVRRLEEVTSIEPYSAVVIGAPMILGWRRAALNFVKKHQGDLSHVPVAYFIMAMSLTWTNQEKMGTVPLHVDPGLARPPANPRRLSLKERYTSITNYASQPLKAAPLVTPVSMAFFGGKLELYRLKLLQSLFVLLILRAQFGSLQNWPAIRQWAAQLSTLLVDRQRA